MEELPFVATENIIMKLVSLGKSRQVLMRRPGFLSHQASDVVKKEGKKNDLTERIKKTEFFKPTWGEVDDLLDPVNFIGRCQEQVLKFCGDQEALKPCKKSIEESEDVELNV
jgi:adenylosuccinate lyase